MRMVVLLVLLVGCAHRQQAPVSEQQRWDDFCKDPPTTGDWQEWCARRTNQRNAERLDQIQQEQRAENVRAQKHRDFVETQAIMDASQAPFRKKN